MIRRGCYDTILLAGIISLRLGEEFLFQVFPFAKQFLCFCNTHKGIFIY